jgi:LacI family repressor for deo operon, udp, cdd, tsx, nupC, and nupG
MEAIAKIGYVPNPAARTLRSQKTRMVLVVLPTLDNVFFSKILRGIEETLFEAGYGMIIGDLDGSPEKEARFASFMAAGQVDGALLLNGHLVGQSRDGRGQPFKTNVPMVALCEAISGADIPQIVVDNRAAAQRMTEYLASLGHRRIAYIRGPGDNVLERERFKGYRDGLQAAGLSFDETLVWPGDYSLGAGVAVGESILARRVRPSAVFSSNDEMAIGLMRTLISAGVRVPEDISVAGFDDIEFAAVVEPPLTTVHQPRRELGQTGATMLLDLLAGRARAPRVRLKTELVVRGSSGPVRR